MSTFREGLDGGGAACDRVTIFDELPSDSNPKIDIGAAVSASGMLEHLSLSPDDLVGMTQREVEALLNLDRDFERLNPAVADTVLLDCIGFGTFLTGAFVRSRIWGQIYLHDRPPFVHQQGAGQDNSWILSTADV